jgi:molybdopterin-guanine dinucleotide biosynthesis protein A
MIVVAPAEMTLPHPASERLADPEGGGGPLTAMVAGMTSARDRAPHEEQLVLAVDLPLLTPESLRALRALRGDALAVVPRPNGVPQPLAAWYGSDACLGLASLVAAGERAVTRAVETLSPRWVDDDVLSRMPGGLDVWFNVNTPDDLARAEAKLMEAHR